MTAEQKRQHWRTHIDLWQKTELTQNAYCLENSLAKSSFSYWRKKLSDTVDDQQPSKFIPFTVVSAPLATLNIAGLRIEIPISALEQVLPVVLRTTRAAR
jgi:hypothetical protein